MNPRLEIMRRGGVRERFQLALHPLHGGVKVIVRDVHLKKLTRGDEVIGSQFQPLLKFGIRLRVFLLLSQNAPKRNVRSGIRWTGANLFPKNGRSIIQSSTSAVGFG